MKQANFNFLLPYIVLHEHLSILDREKRDIKLPLYAYDVTPSSIAETQ